MIEQTIKSFRKMEKNHIIHMMDKASLSENMLAHHVVCGSASSASAGFC